MSLRNSAFGGATKGRMPAQPAQPIMELVFLEISDVPLLKPEMRSEE